jgi:hypothetical protein
MHTHYNKTNPWIQVRGYGRHTVRSLHYFHRCYGSSFDAASQLIAIHRNLFHFSFCMQGIIRSVCLLTLGLLVNEH